MRKYISTLLCLLLLTCSQVTLAAPSMQLEIIPLKHRLVNDIVPILQPLVVEGGSLSGMNNQLIIRTTEQNLQELLKALTAIDKPLRSLKITVRFDEHASHQDRGHGVDGYYDTRNARITTTTPSQHQGSSVTIKGSNGALRYRNWSTDSHNDDDNVYFVRTVEGQAAWINIGQVIPLANRSVYLHPYGVDVYDSVEYKDISSGFYVEPRLSGQQVTLEISPRQSKVSDTHSGRIDIQEAQMTVTGKIGEWIDLGGVSTEYKTHEKRNNERSIRTGGTDSRILVRVEEYN